MRIDCLEIENFKKFSRQSVCFHPQFTLLVGDNGAGKTSILDALAVALGLWHKAAPGSGWRNILTEEIRLEPMRAGDRTFFKAVLPSKISASGAIGRLEGMRWTRMIREGGARTTNAEAKGAEEAIGALVREADEQRALLPVLAYYGAGRAWLATNKRPSPAPPPHKPRRDDAYYNCLDTRIRDRDLNNWFLYEAAASGSNGKDRPGFIAVREAVLNCVPGADRLRYDVDLKEIVLSIDGFEQPFYNLSAGQRMMLALVADIAIKAVTLNSYLFGAGQLGADDPPYVVRESPGVVLIDELDVHLHPKWQRRVATDLKRTFRRIQFVCTTHSPQVIGEVSPGEIRQMEEDVVSTPPRSFGIDSSRILEELMGAPPRNSAVEGLLGELSSAIDREHFDAARDILGRLASQLGPDDPTLTEAQTLIKFLETKT